MPHSLLLDERFAAAHRECSVTHGRHPLFSDVVRPSALLLAERSALRTSISMHAELIVMRCFYVQRQKQATTCRPGDLLTDDRTAERHDAHNKAGRQMSASVKINEAARAPGRRSLKEDRREHR